MGGIMDTQKVSLALSIITRIALGITLLIAAIRNMFFGTGLQVNKILPFLSPGTGLYIIGLIELVIALLLLLGLFTKFAGWLAAIWFILGLILTPFLGVGFQPAYFVLILVAIRIALEGCNSKGLDCVFVKKKEA